MATAVGAQRAGDAETGRGSHLLFAFFRVAVALLWIENVGWKRPPDFDSLRRFTGDAVEYPVFAPFSWVVEHVVLPNFTFFAWMTLSCRGQHRGVPVDWVGDTILGCRRDRPVDGDHAVGHERTQRVGVVLLPDDLGSCSAVRDRGRAQLRT